MGLFEKLFNSMKVKSAEKEERKISEEEAKFNSLNLKEQKAYIEDILSKYVGEEQLKKLINAKPYIFPRIIDKCGTYSLVDVATKKGVSVLDLLGKNSKLQDETIVNIAAKNQPELVFSNLLPKIYKDMISVSTIESLFCKNPAVVLSDCAALKTIIETKGIRKDGKEQVRHSTLKAQLLRATNLYMRPQIYKDNGFDSYAKAIADSIKGAEFVKNLEKMTSSLTTAANEILTKSPEKAKSSSASALHNWNNRVAHKLPKLAKSELTKSKVLEQSKANVVRAKWHKLLCGLLSNPALNSFTHKEKVSLVKDCVSVMPEVYYELSSMGLKDIANESSIQLRAYEAYKKLGDIDSAYYLIEYIGDEQGKKIMARGKANATRKANKANKKASKPAEESIER